MIPFYLTFIAVLLCGLAARVFLCAMAIGLAGGESLIVVPRASSHNPGRSPVMITATLLFHQLTDAARFIVFGIAVATNAPVVVAAGGALGGIALLAIAWARPELVLDRRTRIARRLLGVGFILVGAYVAMRALDWV